MSVYSPPDTNLLSESYGALWACTYRGQSSLTAVPVSAILAVVSMQPLPHIEGDAENLLFVIEKSGLDDMALGEQRDDTLN